MQSVTDWLPIVFTAATTALGFLAYKYSIENFRLNLFKERMDFYFAVWRALSTAAQMGDYSKNDDVEERKLWNDRHNQVMNNIAHEAFHKEKMLFGTDIHVWMDRARNAVLEHALPKNAQQYTESGRTIDRLIKEMPSVFAPYVSFAAYKHRSVIQHILFELRG